MVEDLLSTWPTPSSLILHISPFPPLLHLIDLFSTIKYRVSPQAVVNTVATFLTSEGSLARQSDILVGGLCPGVEDPAGCTEGLPAFWSAIAALLWPGYYAPEVTQFHGTFSSIPGRLDVRAHLRQPGGQRDDLR